MHNGIGTFGKHSLALVCIPGAQVEEQVLHSPQLSQMDAVGGSFVVATVVDMVVDGVVVWIVDIVVDDVVVWVVNTVVVTAFVNCDSVDDGGVRIVAASGHNLVTWHVLTREWH